MLGRTSFVFAALLAAAVPFARAAAAGDPPAASDCADACAPGAARSAPPAPAPAHAEKEWYGWQTLAMDSASVVAFVAGVSRFPALSDAGLAGYVLGGPAVHLGHGRVGVAFADLGVRLTAPLFASLIGYGIDVSSSGPCTGDEICLRGLGGAVIGLLVGHAAAVVLDATVFSIAPTSSAPPAPNEARAAPEPPRFVPSLAIGPRGVSAGVGGSF
jgi:hypothetical protein